ncbi:MAG: hypothetical protein IKW04_00825 [Clostridia bacterium]|nr:hypothetical protein [Clostridia bacterium]
MVKQLKSKWNSLASRMADRKRSRALFGKSYGVALKSVSTKIVNPPAIVSVYPNGETGQLCWIDLEKNIDILSKYYNEDSRLLPLVKTLGAKVPVFYTETYSKAVELLFRLKTEQLTDCFISSSNLEILSACFQEYPQIGRVWCVPSNAEPAELVKTAHSHRVNVICTRDVWSREQVFYFKQRLISTWQFAEDSSDVSLYRLFASGCRAVVTEQADKFSELLMKNSEKTVISQPVIIGHRGISSNQKYMENTLTTAMESVKLGANVIDIDTRLTKDGVLIAFHGWLIDRILEGTGEVRTYTLAELQKMKFRYGLNPEEKVLPLEEFFQKMIEAFPDKKLMFTCEIGGDIVESVGKLKEILDRNPVMQDKLMIKCKNGRFGYAELKKQIPYLPVRNYINDVIAPGNEKKETMLSLSTALHQRTIPWCAKYRKFHKGLLSQLQLRSHIVIKLMQNTVEKVKDDLFSGIELLITDINLAKGFAYGLECDKEVCLSVGKNFTPTVTLHGCAVAKETAADEIVILDGESMVSVSDGNITALKKGVCHIYLKKKTAYQGVEYFVLSDAVKLIVE